MTIRYEMRTPGDLRDLYGLGCNSQYPTSEKEADSGCLRIARLPVELAEKVKRSFKRSFESNFVRKKGLYFYAMVGPKVL